MERETIKGNKALAERLGIDRTVVQRWRKIGALKPATLVDFGRTIIYDLEKVYECMHHEPVMAGRRVRR